MKAGTKVKVGRTGLEAEIAYQVRPDLTCVLYTGPMTFTTPAVTLSENETLLIYETTSDLTEVKP
jgi:hypothetical protein